METTDKIDKRKIIDKRKEKKTWTRVQKNQMLSNVTKIFCSPIFQLAVHLPLTKVLKIFKYYKDLVLYFDKPSENIPNCIDFRVVPVFNMKHIVNNRLFNTVVDWTTMLRWSHETAATVVCNFLLYETMRYIYTTGNGVQIGRFVVRLQETTKTITIQILIREKGKWRDISRFKDGKFGHRSALCFSVKLRKEKRTNTNITKIMTK